MRRSALLLPVFWYGLIASTVRADDYFDNPYLLRLGATLTRSANFAPNLGLQASAARPAGWSVNPASDDVRRRETSTVTATMLSAFSASGTVVTTPVVTFAVPLPEGGTLPIAFARTDSPHGSTKSGLQNPLRSNEFFWGYSRRLSEAHSVGVDFRYAQADVQEETLFSPSTFAPTRFETDSGAVGHHYFEELMLQLGFQNNAFPEIKPEFGEFQFVSLSGVLLF